MDNEVSAAFRRVITDDWGIEFQLISPDVHRRNAAERAIHTFKAHFLAILAGVHSTFPNFLWDKLLKQTGQKTMYRLRISLHNREISSQPQLFPITPENIGYVRPRRGHRRNARIPPASTTPKIPQHLE